VSTLIGFTAKGISSSKELPILVMTFLILYPSFMLDLRMIINYKK